MQGTRNARAMLAGAGVGAAGARHAAIAPRPGAAVARPHRALTPRRAARTAALEPSARAAAVEVPLASASPKAETFDVACPICLETELTVNAFADRARQEPLYCGRCERGFPSAGIYTDLTLEPAAGAEGPQQYTWGGVQIFRSPLVSWLYERGWRQSFSGFGFPGADEETQIALEYLRPAWGQPVLDLSCGSGLFSRRFIKSGRFSSVLVSDFSENMLRQAAAFIDEDPTIDAGKYALVRADAGRLPFRSGSLAGVHAGAALHCWPNPALAVAEISRVLRPGGVFVASTILDTSSGIGSLVGDENIKGLKQLGLFNAIDRPGGPYRMWAEGELREICARMGLTAWRRERRLRFILFAVTKPGGGSQQ